MATTHSLGGMWCLQEVLPAQRKGRYSTHVLWDCVQCLVSGFSGSVYIRRCDLQEEKHNAGRSRRLVLKKTEKQAKLFKVNRGILLFLGNLTVLIGEIAFAE